MIDLPMIITIWGVLPFFVAFAMLVFCDWRTKITPKEARGFMLAGMFWPILFFVLVIHNAIKFGKWIVSDLWTNSPVKPNERAGYRDSAFKKD